MNENAKMWLNALRSGEYIQGRDALATMTSEGVAYCCLGVACDLYRKNADDPLFTVKEAADSEGTGCGTLMFAGEENYLPDRVMEWLGMHDERGTYWDNLHGRNTDLSVKNDSGASFKEIAQILEDREDELF